MVLTQLAWGVHPLKYLFLELTRRCNLRCAHCGSSCPAYTQNAELPTEAFLHVVDRVAEAFPADPPLFCITGGEPLLHPDWFTICSHIREKGLSWGMTTNGTLIDQSCVRRLAQAGMKSVAVSLDGGRQSHEKLRGVQGCFDKAVKALELLKESGSFRAVGVTTVVSKLNLGELEKLYSLMKQLGVDSWMLTPVEPMGDASGRRELFLEEEEHKLLLDFIRERRREAPFDLAYGCSHFLPEEYDAAVRKQPFLCIAGTMVASIASNGDILPCLDIDCRELVKQGNVQRDDFPMVWNERFERFRRNKAESSPLCRDCEWKKLCCGDSWHSWDFAENRPRICLRKHIVF